MNQRFPLLRACLLLLAFITALPLSSSHADRPNVLVIYGDDQGSVDLGGFGATDLKMDHLNRLGDQGLRLTQMYAPAPVCSASRVGLLTGRYPARAGQAGNGPLNSDEITIAETFAAAGYRTAHVGKWHLGTTETQIPSGQGFQSWFGHLQGCIDNYSHFFFWSGPNRHDLWDNGTEIYRPGEYFPDLMVEQCKAVIDENGDKPWLMYWAFNAPHYPYQGSPAWLEAYKDLPSPRREYNAFLSTMDDHIGEVLAYLDAKGLADNTIVIYQPDHGHSTETRAFGGGGNAGPYRGAKFSLFEGGIRVPCVVRFPKRFPAGETRDQFVTACDWYPTLCELCGIEPPAQHLDGVSIVKVLADDAAAPRESFYWQFGNGKNAQWAVRDGDWKLIGNPVDTSLPEGERNATKLPELFLSNLSRDISEQTNRSETEPEVLQRMLRLRETIVRDFAERSR